MFCEVVHCGRRVYLVVHPQPLKRPQSPHPAGPAPRALTPLPATSPPAAPAVRPRWPTPGLLLRGRPSRLCSSARRLPAFRRSLAAFGRRCLAGLRRPVPRALLAAGAPLAALALLRRTLA